MMTSACGFASACRSTVGGHRRPVGPGRAALGPVADLPPQVLASGAPVVVVSQGTVDNADQDKLLAHTLTAPKNQPHVVVATTGGVGTG